MLIVSKGTVIHNGKKYESGEILPAIPEDQEDRLVKLEVCQKVPDRVEEPNKRAAPETEKPETPESQKSMAESLNLKADPAQVIQTGRKRK